MMEWLYKYHTVTTYPDQDLSPPSFLYITSDLASDYSIKYAIAISLLYYDSVSSLLSRPYTNVYPGYRLYLDFFFTGIYISLRVSSRVGPRGLRY